MAFFDLSKRTKKIIVVVLNSVATGFLGIAMAFGVELSWWQPVTALVVVALDTILGIKWSAPEKQK